MSRIFLLVFLALTLSACTLTSENCTRLPGNGNYCLVPGAWPEFSAEQSSVVTLRGQTMRLITRISSGPDGVSFAGLSPLGQTIFLISWENGKLRAEMPKPLEGRIDPVLFLGLLQLATWPVENIREGLSKGLELIEGPNRRVIHDGTDNVLVLSWEGKQVPYSALRIEVPAIGLTIDSKTLESDH